MRLTQTKFGVSWCLPVRACRAPETFEGRYKKAADVYALGACLGGKAWAGPQGAVFMLLDWRRSSEPRARWAALPAGVYIGARPGGP